MGAFGKNLARFLNRFSGKRVDSMQSDRAGLSVPIVCGETWNLPGSELKNPNPCSNLQSSVVKHNCLVLSDLLNYGPLKWGIVHLECVDKHLFVHVPKQQMIAMLAEGVLRKF